MRVTPTRMKGLRKKIHPNSGLIPIGKLSKKTNLKVVTIRYYESLKLLPDPRRKASPKNRKYSEAYVSRLVFIKKARDLGFSLKEISEMIRWVEKEKKIPRKSLVKKVYAKMDIIEQKILQLRSLRRELYKLLTGE